MSPTSMTMRPLTVFGPGNARHSPPGQCATAPGVVPKPGVPPQGASVRSIVRSVPAAEVTRISLASRSIWMPSATLGPSAAVGSQRSRISGCSLQTTRMRAPASSISGHSAAWIMPSTVQSTMISHCFIASIAARLPWMASDVPVDLTGTGAVWRGVGIVIMQ